MTKNNVPDFNKLYNDLPKNKQKTIQELRRKMAADLGIQVKDSIPFELYLLCVRSKPMEVLHFEGKTFNNTFVIRGRAMTILETIDPQWKEHYDID